MQIKFTPFLKQYEAYQKLTDDKTLEILYGGGARGGKSYFGCAWVIMNCLSMKGSAWLIGRNELKRLRQTTLITFFEVAKDFGLSPESHFNYNGQESTIIFKNGSTIFLVDLRYMPSDPKYDRLGSYGLTGCFIDEVQEIDPQVPNILKGRFSMLKGEGRQTKPKMLYTCNPGKGWINTEFWQPFKNGTLPENKCFIQSLVTDNPHISQDYIDALRTADKITVERLLKGNFDYDDVLGKLYEYDRLVQFFHNKGEKGEKYITGDIAGAGKDRTIILVWDGWVVIDYKILKNNKIDQDLDNVFLKLAKKYDIPMSNIMVDQIGIGEGVVGHLKCRGFIAGAKVIQPSNGKKDDTKKLNYINLRSQCYFYLTNAVKFDKINCRILEGYKTEIIEELDAICEINFDKDDKRQVIKKEDIKKLIGRSPDWADNFMMRCWFELKSVGSFNDVKKINETFNRSKNEIILNTNF